MRSLGLLIHGSVAVATGALQRKARPAEWRKRKSNARNRNSDAVQSKTRCEEKRKRTVVVDERAVAGVMALKKTWLGGDQRTRAVEPFAGVLTGGQTGVSAAQPDGGVERGSDVNCGGRAVTRQR